MLAIAYGSVAKNHWKAGSDLDIFILIKAKNKTLQKDIYSAAGGLSLKYNQTLAPMIMTAAEFRKLLKKEDTFLQNVMKGEIIYGKKPS